MDLAVHDNGVPIMPASLDRALTHRSYAYENANPPTNERLEFLGDSVLGLVVTDTLFRGYPNLPEGQLAKLRASIEPYKVPGSSTYRLPTEVMRTVEAIASPWDGADSFQLGLKPPKVVQAEEPTVSIRSGLDLDRVRCLSHKDEIG